MKTTFRDIEQLSAYLDGQLPQAETTSLESRLGADPALAAALEELRQARAVLRRTPRRRAPRNFTLTPQMAGIRPPLPRAVPAFSWASAVAMLLFIFTLGANWLGQVSLGASAPMMAAAPANIGGGPEDESFKAAEPPSDFALTPTPEMFALTLPEQPAEPTERMFAAPAEPPQPPLNPWLVIWPSLAVLLFAAAALTRWLNWRRFRKSLTKK